MRRKELGKTGVMVPEIGLGTWAYHGGAELLRTGLDAGALFIDTAESYGTEPVVGKCAAQIALNWCLWHETVVAIPKGNSRENLMENCGASDWRLSREDFARLSDSIVHRPRGSLDALVWRCLPSGFKQQLKGLGRLLPPAMRRRLK